MAKQQPDSGSRLLGIRASAVLALRVLAGGPLDGLTVAATRAAVALSRSIVEDRGDGR